MMIRRSIEQNKVLLGRQIGMLILILMWLVLLLRG
jgi:hypothetical protein